ncbi:N-acetylmuramoyl-L-alanine amidase [Arenimonas oryziterrae]|uniref:N-acetylmuramoyl-L-alanine amidase AmiC n=1 Tax=Arenimonas oryziterrae DSM 21050 = YC6267 TaxID=1121015 RepID=A0A091APT9_9GAMM|nr:N-acetylmuramoyl-L-alanine amidase [Arenimonas oryziterrae]KFN41162.1 hypothetical protein N789_04555 [Arenimonas oryziterrae DSM 21050 = YC6267]
MRPMPSLITLFAALALPVSAASAADLRAVKLMENDLGTRAVVDLSGPVEYKYFTLQNPERLVLDIQGGRLDGRYGAPAANGVVTNVRTGKPTPDTLRIVFELGRTVTAQGRLEREGGGSRLVLDLTPPGAKARPIVPSQQTSMAVSSPPSVAPSTPAPVVVAPVLEPREPVVPRAAPARTLRDVIGGSQRELIVAIDAGHGGKDPGAHGPSGLNEKVVTLAVARELARQIDADPGMKAVLIREGDSFVQLQDRYMIARRAQADLFISIHADAALNNSASGASVYVLSTRGASSQAARWLADKENAADLVGGVSLDDKDRNLSAVLLDLSQSATMRASDDIASQVLASLKNVGKAHKAGVERANFVVLRSPDVPSMLVETGFITNPGEEKKLNDPDYRRRLASAIASGVRQYFTDQPPPGTWYAAQQADGETVLASVPDKPVRSATRQHVVSRGETLTLIAAQHGVPVNSLREANNKHTDRVRVGERLKIPLIASAPE